MNTYLDLVLQGKNEWWRYIVALVVIAFLWLVLGSTPYAGLAILVLGDGNPATDFDSATARFTGLHPLMPFVALMLSFVFLLAGIYLAVRWVHGRPLSSLVSPGLRWARLGQAFGLWLLLAAILAIFEAILHPNRFQLTFEPLNFFVFSLAALVLVPVQSTAEELLFRGYVLQGVGLRIRHRLLLSAVSGLIFMLPHLSNPEVSVSLLLFGLYYFVFGAFLAFVTLKDGGLEIALGVHAANNLFTAIFANYVGSALQTPAIFTARELDAVYALFSVLLAMAVLYYWFFWPVRPKSAS